MTNKEFLNSIKEKKQKLEATYDCYTWDKWQSLVNEMLNFYDKPHKSIKQQVDDAIKEDRRGSFMGEFFRTDVD
jgi:hypothetical protein